MLSVISPKSQTQSRSLRCPQLTSSSVARTLLADDAPAAAAQGSQDEDAASAEASTVSLGNMSQRTEALVGELARDLEPSLDMITSFLVADRSRKEGL